MQTKKEAKNSGDEKSFTSTATKAPNASKSSKTEKTSKQAANDPSTHGDSASSTNESYKNSSNLSSNSTSAKNKSATAKVTIKYDVGFGNTLTIRGHGADLSWEKGIELKNAKANEWTWEAHSTFTKCEFKILINDTHFETGPNHVITYGSSVNYTPHFPQNH